jgi:hypothetical protein
LASVLLFRSESQEALKIIQNVLVSTSLAEEDRLAFDKLLRQCQASVILKEYRSDCCDRSYSEVCSKVLGCERIGAVLEQLYEVRRNAKENLCRESDCVQENQKEIRSTFHPKISYESVGDQLGQRGEVIYLSLADEIKYL